MTESQIQRMHMFITFNLDLVSPDLIIILLDTDLKKNNK